MAHLATPPAPSRRRILARRSASTLFLWALVTGIFLSGNAWGFLGLIATLTVIATIEYFKMLKAASIPCSRSYGITLAVLYSAGIYGYFLTGKTAIPQNYDDFAFFLAVAGPFILQLRHPIRGMGSLLAVAANLLGFVYIAFLFNFAARVTFMAPGANAVPGLVGSSGAMLLLWLLAVTKFTDMGAYIVGSMVGRHKMIPHVSPGKTWEGFAGALVFAQLAACGLYALFPVPLACLGSWGHVVTLGFILAIFAVVGDLAESVLKRSINAKDSGRILPGIGGSLDLIDSICFTAPALYFYMTWILLPAA